MELRVNPERLSILQKICMWLHQHLYLCTIDNKPYYAFKCKKHGLVINYLKWYGEYLKCPTCFSQSMTRARWWAVLDDIEFISEPVINS
jgi:hypothetical protein